MSLLLYPEFLEKIKPFIGSYIRFLYIREPDKKWKFASLYLCLEDTIKDQKLYEKDGIDVDFRVKPTSGERLEVKELNENLNEIGVKIIRFIEQECEDGFVLSVEIKES